MRWIDVKYKCRCMSEERTLPIGARDQAEPILEFMERLQSSIGYDHHRRSPLCIATKIEYVKVPVEGDLR